MAVAACGGDDGEAPPPAMMMPEPEPELGTIVKYAVSDPCTSDVPQPNDLFIVDSRSEATDCTPPTDPVEAAVQLAQLNEGAPLDSEVTIPVDGSFDASASVLTGTVTFTFTSTQSTEPRRDWFPTIVMLERREGGAETSSGAWSIVDPSRSFSEGKLFLRPPQLKPGTRYVVVATRALKDLEGKSLDQSPEVAAVTSTQSVVAADIPGLTTDGAARLERARRSYQDILQLLNTPRLVNPTVPRDAIVSIQTFTTEKGFARMDEEVQRYYEAIAAERYGYQVSVEEVQAPSIFSYIPPVAYPEVASTYRGVLKAPQFVDETGSFRPDWDQAVETVDIHFTITTPRGVMAGPVVIHIPGYNRGNVDGRSIANSIAEDAGAFVVTVDMRCHGFRSPDVNGNCIENRSQSEINGLTDAVPNSNNPDDIGDDGLPDDSGLGFFPGDFAALRDTQLAAVLEIMHIIESFGNVNAYQPALTPNVGRIHVIAQGYMATPALIASSLTDNVRLRTIALPSGGADLAELITNGAPAQRDDFLAQTPFGFEVGNVATTLNELSVMFEPLDLQRYREEIRTRFLVRATSGRILLNHGSVTQFISAAARQSLVDAIGLPSQRISEHIPVCDNFYLHSCRAGQPPEQQTAAVTQLAFFINSDGVTVRDPAR